MKKSITEIAYKVKNLGITSFQNRMEDQDLNTSREIVKNIKKDLITYLKQDGVKNFKEIIGNWSK